MAYSIPFTAVTGASILASQWNTSGRDNLIALWVYTTAGDIAYATSPTALQRLGIGANGTALVVSGGVPTWGIPGGAVNVKNIVSFSPAQTVNGWSYITGAVLTLTLTYTSTILVLASVLGKVSDTSDLRTLSVRAIVDQTYAPSDFPGNSGSNSYNRLENLGYFHLAEHIAAGARGVWLQAMADGGADGYIASGYLQAWAFKE